MATKRDLESWVMDAIDALGGGGTVVEISREVWSRHEPDLRASGDLFYTWQYDMRWAAQRLRDAGKLMSAADAPHGIWALSRNGD